MNFWKTALAAFVGGIGVLAIGALFRFSWLIYRARFTAFGRHLVKTGTMVEKALKDAEERSGEK